MIVTRIAVERIDFGPAAKSGSPEKDETTSVHQLPAKIKSSRDEETRAGVLCRTVHFAVLSQRGALFDGARGAVKR